MKKIFPPRLRSSLFNIAVSAVAARRLCHTATAVLLAVATALPLVSCVDEDDFANTPRGNFEALWKMMDEHYCFFTEKGQTLGVDWNEVHSRYAAQLDDRMSEDQLFEVLGNMLGELRDGHVNMYSSWDVARNWSWHEDYPSNVSDTLLRRYLGTDYRIAASLKYRILDDNIGYIRCASFANTFGEGNLDEVMMYLSPCRALIIDVRDNGGGQVTAAEQLAARFVNAKTLVGYMQHKRGKGHDDFSDLEPQWLKPSNGLRWQKRVAVLTNRSVYSAANEFVKYMRCGTRVMTVGDNTGGGAGMPFSSELPIGWSVRFSACPMYDAQKRSVEQGIAPDHAVSLSDTDARRGLDTIIEEARRRLVMDGNN